MTNNNTEIAKYEDQDDFELELKHPEPVKSKFVIWLSAAGLLAIIAIVILLLTSSNPRSTSLKNVVRAGAPEFEAYKNNVKLVKDKDMLVFDSPIMKMFYMEIRGTITNNGDKPITGFELMLKMVDLNDKVIATNIGVPIPAVRTEPLQPGETYKFKTRIDAPSNVLEGDVKDVNMELRGLQFK